MEIWCPFDICTKATIKISTNEEQQILSNERERERKQNKSVFRKRSKIVVPTFHGHQSQDFHGNNCNSCCRRNNKRIQTLRCCLCFRTEKFRAFLRSRQFCLVWTNLEIYFGQSNALNRCQKAVVIFTNGNRVSQMTELLEMSGDLQTGAPNTLTTCGSICQFDVVMSAPLGSQVIVHTNDDISRVVTWTFLNCTRASKQNSRK